MSYHEDYGSRTEADAGRFFFAVHGGGGRERPDPSEYAAERECVGCAAKLPAGKPSHELAGGGPYCGGCIKAAHRDAYPCAYQDDPPMAERVLDDCDPYDDREDCR